MPHYVTIVHRDGAAWNILVSDHHKGDLDAFLNAWFDSHLTSSTAKGGLLVLHGTSPYTNDPCQIYIKNDHIAALQVRRTPNNKENPNTP